MSTDLEAFGDGPTRIDAFNSNLECEETTAWRSSKWAEDQLDKSAPDSSIHAYRYSRSAVITSAPSPRQTALVSAALPRPFLAHEVAERRSSRARGGSSGAIAVVALCLLVAVVFYRLPRHEPKADGDAAVATPAQSIALTSAQPAVPGAPVVESAMPKPAKRHHAKRALPRLPASLTTSND